LYAKRSRKGTLSIFRIPIPAGDAEELPIPREYQVAYPALSPAAVDAHGRVLISVASNSSFYYKTAILDPVTKSFTIVPVTVDGDVSTAGWMPDGSILANGQRY